jgi:hypothetical protein
VGADPAAIFKKKASMAASAVPSKTGVLGTLFGR